MSFLASHMWTGVIKFAEPEIIIGTVSAHLRFMVNVSKLHDCMFDSRLFLCTQGLHWFYSEMDLGAPFLWCPGQVKFIQIQGVEIRHWGDAREPSRWNRGFLPNVCPLKQIVGIQRPWLPTSVSRIMLSQQVGWPEFQTRWIPSGETWQWNIHHWSVGWSYYTLPRWGFGVLVVRHRQRDPHRWIARRGRGQCRTTHCKIGSLRSYGWFFQN